MSKVKNNNKAKSIDVVGIEIYEKFCLLTTNNLNKIRNYCSIIFKLLIA